MATTEMLDPYAFTAAGHLGTHRETMLQNELLIRVSIGWLLTTRLHDINTDQACVEYLIFYLNQINYIETSIICTLCTLQVLGKTINYEAYIYFP